MDLIKQIFDSGVVGCGGAGFPTHVKLKASPEILIINGAECEPLLRTDRYLMIHEAEKLVSGVDLITGHTFIRSDHHIGTANGILIYDSIRITEVF